MIALFVGGANSGKSEIAERFTARLPAPVTYVATWVPNDDAAMHARIAAHRARRPAAWALREAGQDLAGALREIEGTVLVDALGTWVAAIEDFAAEPGQLCAALADRRGDTVVVSDEVGLGVHPSTAIGGRFREVLGRVNAAVSAVADEVWFVVAGRTLPLTPPAW